MCTGILKSKGYGDKRDCRKLSPEEALPPARILADEDREEAMLS